MSWMDEYQAALKEEKKKKKKETSSANSSSFMDEYREELDEIAPVVQTTTKATPVTDENGLMNSLKNRSWFQKGAFADGYQFGDITKTILGTGVDAGGDAATGVVGIGEKVVDFLATIAPYIAQGQYYANGSGYNIQANQAFTQAIDTAKAGSEEFVKKDLYDEEKIAKFLVSGSASAQALKAWDTDAEEASVLGEKSDALVQSAGQMGAQLALNAALPGSGMALMGMTAYGGEAENALKQGATLDEAALSGAISAGAEMLTEQISGGIKFGNMGTLDDVLTKNIARGISDKAVRTAAKLGMDMVGEGGEEVLSGIMSAVGQKLTYASDKELKELFSKEEAWESFIGGAVLGFGGGSVQAGISKANGVDYVSGLTTNEQKVVDKLYQDAITEESKNGKVTKKRKAEIYDGILEQMDKGYISIETIEDILGDKSAYDSLAKESEEYNTLYNTATGQMSKAQQDRLAELEAKNSANPYKDALDASKKQFSQSVRDMVKGDRLSESYNEKFRMTQDFEADFNKYKGTKYEDAAKKTIESAIKAGANNSNRVHDLVEMAAKTSADTGLTFEFKSGEQIKSDFVARQKAEIEKLEGMKRTAEQNELLAKLKDTLAKVESGEMVVNGDISGGSIVLNLDSKKPLNRVVGHEITHSFEPAKGQKTAEYTELKDSLFAYAKTKGMDIEAELAKRNSLYAGLDADAEAELVADLVGDFLFTDSKYIQKLSAENMNLFQRLWNEVKYLCRIARAGSQEARELERVKKAFEDAYRESGKKNGNRDTDVKNSISETTDGRFVAVVDNDILSNIDTSTLDKETKKKVKKAANEELKKFADGFTINGIEFIGNSDTRREYTRTDYTEALSRKNPTAYFDKMRAAAVLDDVIQVATDWKNDNKIKHDRDDYVDFVRGKTLIMSGDRAYRAVVLAGITSDGRAIFHDVEDVYPDSFKLKKSESSTAVSANESPNYNLEDSDAPTVAQKGEEVKHKLSLSDSDGKQLTKETDTAYMDAVNRGDTETARMMVNDFARKAGYEHQMFHETDAENIHVFDVNRGDHGATDYETPYGIFTKTSRKNIGLGSKQMELFVKAHNTLRVEDRADVLNKIPGFVEYYDQIQAIDEKYDALSEQFEDEEFDALAEWMEDHPDADMDALLPNSYIIEGKPADIDSERYLNAHKKYQEVRAEWTKAYDAVAVKAKAFITDYLRSNGYDSMYFAVDGGSRGRQTDSLIVLDPNQVKSADPVTYDDDGNVIPLSERFNAENDDIRYSLSEEVTEAQNEQGLGREHELQYSLSRDTEFSDNAIAVNESSFHVSKDVMANAKAIRGRIAARMNEIKDNGLVGLPEDIEGNTYIANSSYDGTEENTTICPRSLASEAFVDAVSEYLGRPLTVEEQIYISQDLQGRSLTPECTYCYVATDRKAYRAFLGEYVNQRDSVLQKLKENPTADVSRSGELYKEFLGGRKDTNPMYSRFKMWVDAYKTGTPMVEASHLANLSKLMGDINSEFGEELKPQIMDAMKYAQSASWAKKRVNYVAYNGHILKWKQDRINKLNSHYGLRMYSFSDFHPAFVLENMQMITDASVRGLKMLGYTKDTDFVDIFAPSGMNINVSTFGFEMDGNVYENNIIGANWEKAKQLRAQYPNVGITFVATNDTLVNWALEQDWIDVVIPYHLVRTGAEVAKAFNYTNYTSESADTKDVGWGKGDKKYIAPTEHNNDKATYLAALEKNHLKPRFARFLDNPNYMKLVNECRQSASESKPVQPVFNEEAANTALSKLEANGYYQPIGGSVDRMYEIAAEVADSMIAPTQNSLSYSDEDIAPGKFDVYGSDFRVVEGDDGFAPVGGTVSNMETVETPTDEDDFAPEFGDAPPKKFDPYEANGVERPVSGNTRKELHSNIVENIRSVFFRSGYDFDEVLKKAKNLSTFATVDNTPQRVMEKSLGYKEGQILSDLTVNQVAQNETEKIKWLNSYTDRKNGVLAQISKQYNIKPGSKESAAAQMYAEGFYVGENNEIIQYGDAELAADFKSPEVRENIKKLAGDPRIRQIYDETLAMINESRARNLYPEIQRLDNYFLHFRAMDDTFSRLGLPFNPNDIRAKDLPTDLNGVTADLKPGQPYFASAKHRTGKRTSFDLLGGLERYLTSAGNQIYHIDDIQTLRALRNYIAETYGQASGLEGLDELSDEEAQERIKQVYDSHLSTFAKFLNEEANIIAGKTALIDRGLEGIIGRRGITFLNTVNGQVGSNMVGFNISSSLTNFLPVVQTFAKSNKFDFVKAFAQTVSNKVQSVYGKGDDFAENSPVVIRRKGADRFYRTPFQKVGDAGYVFMSAVDDISTELIARTKYNELTRKGMDSQQAHFETDKWVSRLMGDRSMGQQPQLYNSKMLGLITKFQLEVRNQLDSQFYDTIQEAKASNEDIQNGLERNAKIAAKVGSTFVQLAVAQHLFGKAFESVAGYNPAFDIIETIIKAFGWDDEEEEPVLDNLEEAFLGLLEDLPYTSTFTGGRIPIASALPVKQFLTGKDEYGNEKSRLETLGEVAPYYVLPGGYGQIKKTVQGLGMFSDDHPISGSYTDSGNLRFPVEDTFGNRLQAGIFGQYASKNARDYFDNERSALKEKQIEEFMASGLSIQDYWDYREGLSGLSKLSEKADYIDSLDLTDEQKNLFINNIADRKEDIDMSNYGDFDDFEEFDFATKNPEKYDFLTSIGISYKDYASADDDTKEAYDWAFKNPEKFTLSKSVTGDVAQYKKFTKELYDIKADKDANGNSITGSRKEKVIDYVNSLNADYGAKIILFKSEYPADDTYNNDIVDYLNGREDISYDEMVTILKELGFTVDSNGNVSW